MGERREQYVHIQFALLADSVEIRPDGRLNVTAIGPFTIQATQFPATVPEFSVVTRVRFDIGDDEAGELAVRVFAPNGAVVAERQSAVEAPPVIATRTADRTRTRVLTFFKVPLPVPGTYHVHVKLNGVDFLTRINFDVELVAVGSVSTAGT